jgi:hypothetical protein
VGFALRELQLVRPGSGTLEGNEGITWAIMLLWARLLPLVYMHKRMVRYATRTPFLQAAPSTTPVVLQGPLLEMLIKILTRDVVDWLGLMVLIMLTFAAAMWFLLGSHSSASLFDRRFRNWYTSLQTLFQVVLESTQLDQTLAVENGHPQIAWYGPMCRCIG